MPTSPENERLPEPTDKEVDGLGQDLAVSSAEQDTMAHLAPHHRVPPGDRVEGSYIVSVRNTADLAAVVKRAGVEMDRAFTPVIHAFAAHLTDEQVTALRRDPEVTQIEDDQYTTLDD
jgi:hypothetical protein